MAKRKPKSAGGLGRFSALAMALSVLGIALCAGLLFLQLIQTANSNNSDALADNQAAALAAVVDARYNDLRTLLTLQAGQAAAAVALQSKSPEALAAGGAQIQANLPFARRVDLIPRGAAKVDLAAQTPINFVALDVIRRAESAAFVGPEASANPRDIIYAAAPVTGSEGVLGVLFVALSADYLKSALAGFDTSRGLMQIEQAVDNSAPAIVLEHGSGTPSLVVNRKPLKAPGWSLLFSGQPAPAVVGLMDLLLPLAASLVLGLGGIWLAFSRLGTAIKEDSEALAEYGNKVLGGHAGKTDHFQINTFQKLANALGTALGETGPPKRRPGGPVAAAGATAPSKSEEQPEAPLDELLDDIEQSAGGVDETEPEAKSSAAAPLPEEEPEATLEDDFLDIGDDDDLGATSSVVAAMPEVREGLSAPADDNFGIGVDEVENAIPNVDFDPGIFRAYDIRGIVDTNLTPQVVHWIGRAFAAEARSKGQTRTAVGRDGRLSSPELAQELIRGLLTGGMDVVDIGQVATPMLYFATHSLNTGTGIMITGSHNPPKYNGLKMMIGGETLAEDRITQLYQRLVDNNLEHDVAEGELAAVVIDNDYMERILDDVAVAQPLKIVVDCGNGVAGGIAPLLLQELGCEVVPLYCEIDGTFPNHHPDPADPANMRDLMTVVKAEDADAGIAFDGDGDRIGVVTNTGEIIWPDKLMMLFAKDIVGRNPGADIIYDVKCSRHLNNLISEYGGRPIMWKTGHSHIKAKLKETGALLAGEFSGHVAFGERWYGFDDAIYTAARLLEIVGGDTASMAELFEEFPETQATPELKINTTEEAKFQVIDRLAAEADFGDGTVTAIDGVRVDYANSWGLIRASNTSPVLTLRFEADTVTALDEVQTVFRAELAKIDPELKF